MGGEREREGGGGGRGKKNLTPNLPFRKTSNIIESSVPWLQF